MRQTPQLKAPELGARIRAARKRSGLSHDCLGAIVGTSRQHLIRLEQGWHRPSPELLGRIAEATDTTVDDLLPDDVQEAALPGGQFRDARGATRGARRGARAAKGTRASGEPMTGDEAA